MKKRTLSFLLALVMCLSLLPMTALAASDANNGDWDSKTITMKNTSEAEYMVRTGDIDALNDSSAIQNGYNPFTAKNQRPHGWQGGWTLDTADPAGTDRVFVGTRWSGKQTDGYAQNYASWKNGGLQDKAFGEGALTISMNYDLAGISVKNALLQLCIDDFQALNWNSNFTVTLNGKDAPFIAELLNQVDQTGPVSYITSAVIPSGFFSDVSSGALVISIDETTGVGDGFAIDFAKLLINYDDSLFTGEFSGTTEPGATVRLLGTSTTVTASNNGGFSFEAIPGLNAVRASKDGFKENYEFGIVLSSDTEWAPNVKLSAGAGTPDIDFSQFGTTDAWADASEWALGELEKAEALGLIPDCLVGQDLTKPITRREFAAVVVKLYENLTGETAEPAAENPFTDTDDAEVLKAYNIEATLGTSATTYSPENILPREEGATMLTRVVKKHVLPGWTLATDSQFTLPYEMPTPFTDDAKISAWARDSVYYMASKGIILGVPDGDALKFNPRHLTTEEAAIGFANLARQEALLFAVRTAENID